MAAITMALISIVGTGMLAQVNSRKQSKAPSEDVSVMSFAAGSPSRELVYAGGRLIATEDCSPSLSPAYRSFPAAAQTGNTIAVNSSCGWTAVASSPDNFITITSGSSGSGNGQITYDVAINGGTTIRSGSITVTPTGQTIGQIFNLFQGKDFLDVPPSHIFYAFIGQLAARGVTVGCDASNYCPDQAVTREQMAAFIIRALGDPTPPTPPSQRFLDVPPSNPFYAFIEQMAVRGITVGCGTNEQGQPIYCPSAEVTREQMAAFLLRGIGEFNPPLPTSQRFLDVPPTNTFYNFIERMGALNITSGCGGGNYCPTGPVTRGMMAVFLVRAFKL